MVISSFHPVYSFQSSREDKLIYHKFSLRKTIEFSYLWYLYARNFLGKNTDILIIDQNSNFSINDILDKVDEKYDVSSISNYLFDINTKLHIKKFENKVMVLKGVKRLYQYMYRFCYHNNLDFFYIENDCLIAKDFFKISQEYDFATNTIDLKHRACDTYINFIKLSRLKEQDIFLPLPKYLNLIKDEYDNSNDEVCPDNDIACRIMNERGAYFKYCYGNILCYNWDGIYHQGTNEELITFLEKYPIDNPFYKYFLEKGKEIINECSKIKDK
jgi:hypothetical protein